MNNTGKMPAAGAPPVRKPPVRTIATEKAVWAAAERLEAAGEQPTLIRVREAVGGGSLSTISSHIATWKESRAALADRAQARNGISREEAIERALGDLRSHLGAAFDRLGLVFANGEGVLRQTLDAEKAEMAEAAAALHAQLNAAAQREAELRESLKHAGHELDGRREAELAAQRMLLDAGTRIAAAEGRAEDLAQQLTAAGYRENLAKDREAACIASLDAARLAADEKQRHFLGIIGNRDDAIAALRKESASAQEERQELLARIDQLEAGLRESEARQAIALADHAASQAHIGARLENALKALEEERGRAATMEASLQRAREELAASDARAAMGKQALAAADRRLEELGQATERQVEDMQAALRSERALLEAANQLLAGEREKSIQFAGRIAALEATIEENLKDRFAQKDEVAAGLRRIMQLERELAEARQFQPKKPVSRRRSKR